MKGWAFVSRYDVQNIWQPWGLDNIRVDFQNQTATLWYSEGEEIVQTTKIQMYSKNWSLFSPHVLHYLCIHIYSKDYIYFDYTSGELIKIFMLFFTKAI